MSERTGPPEHWASVRLGDHTTVKARLGWKGLKAEEYVEDGYIFLATPNDLLQVFRTVDSLILDGWRRAVRCRRAVPGSLVIGPAPNVGSTRGS